LEGVYSKYAQGTVDALTGELTMTQAGLVALCTECALVDAAMASKIFMVVRVPKKANLRFAQFQEAWRKISAAKRVSYEVIDPTIVYHRIPTYTIVHYHTLLYTTIHCRTL
jgi:hypothetical protein